MKGDSKVIEYLNELLAGELASIDQYFIHSRMYEDWGLTKLHARIDHEMSDETAHADLLIKRILFLEGIPNLITRPSLDIGKTVPEMLQSDLNLEIEVAESLKKAMAHCEEVRDYQTREVLQILLRETEEDHAYWLRKQLGLIEKMGLENYLQTQM